MRDTSDIDDGELKRVDAASLANLFRPLSERSESVRPFVPSIGGNRIYLLLLYASVIIGSAVEFFMSKEIWYGNWEVYNSYVFVVSGIFVLLGLVMLFSITGRVDEEDWPLPFGRPTVGVLGLLVFFAGGIGLLVAGTSVGGWAVLLSVALLVGFLMIVLGSRSISTKEGTWLAVFGAGIVLMALAPVHEVFDVARSAPGEYPFTALNLVLLAVGMALSLLSLLSLKTKDGFLGSWLMGAMVIFLVSFHEQIGINSTDTYDQYDRGLALIGIVFSFLPLVMYVWREKEYYSLWAKLRAAQRGIETGEYKRAVEFADAALAQSSAIGIDRRFALPWTLKADAYYRMKQYSKARTNYDVSLEIFPEDTISWCHLGNINAFEGRRAVALTCYDRSMKANPNNGYAWNNKGVVFNSLQWPEEAHACFSKAVEIMPRSFDAQLNMARMCAKLGKTDDAVKHFQIALSLRPGSREAEAGLHEEWLRSMCLDQIRGWEQLGMDVTYLKALMNQDLEDFEEKTKEFLSSIVEQKTHLTIGMGAEKFDVNEAVKTILRVAGQSGATMERLEKESGLTKAQLVLPMALLMKTDHLHFKRSGPHEVYVAVGPPPEKPPEPPPPPPAEKEAKRKGRRQEFEEVEIEPTASVLMFGRKKRKTSK